MARGQWDKNYGRGQWDKNYGRESGELKNLKLLKESFGNESMKFKKF